MSVKLNTNIGQGVSPSGVPPDKPKSNLLHWWVDQVYEGSLKEKLSPEDYCKRIWKQKPGDPPIAQTKPFQSCMDDVIEAKRYAEFSARN